VKISAAHNSEGSESSINCSQWGTKGISLPDYAVAVIEAQCWLHITRKTASRQRQPAALHVSSIGYAYFETSWPK
jgi:hypothetical protein